MIFRNFRVKCADCKHFEPKADDPKTGTCQNVDIEDADEQRDCRWYDSKNSDDKSDGD